MLKDCDLVRNAWKVIVSEYLIIFFYCYGPKLNTIPKTVRIVDHELDLVFESGNWNNCTI